MPLLDRPGLIDAHWHTGMVGAKSPDNLLNANPTYMGIRAAKSAEQALMRGFTSVRAASGLFEFGVKRAVDEGVAGPRMWPSGAGIRTTYLAEECRPGPPGGSGQLFRTTPDITWPDGAAGSL